MGMHATKDRVKSDTSTVYSISLYESTMTTRDEPWFAFLVKCAFGLKSGLKPSTALEGGKKDQSAAGSSKKRKEKTTNYTDENAKRKEVVVSGLLEHDEVFV
ncbi:hypothetical protein H5410_016439 [Solanum commersonii]|uniref:Uncharacterized protein n=1 Tax=Solanum commersonii TaxID=4109 RepID=A0A9J5ZXN0_SOLCO|nr:hypothetical protein H5410_016439 [Solanum commersonii]